MDDGVGTWDANRDLWQEIVNSLPIPSEDAQRRCEIPVRARIVWERDGEQYIDTIAYGYTREAGLILVEDRRWQGMGVWLRPEDIARRARD